MYLVATDPRFGVVAAPSCPADLEDEASVQVLEEAGFAWNDVQEMFACDAGGPEARRSLASWAAGVLWMLGHEVITRHLTVQDVQAAQSPSDH